MRLTPEHSRPAGDMLALILPRLDRGDSTKWPDERGEYWTLCPFHADEHTGSFSVSERGYRCFACGESGGLSGLAAHLGVLPERQAPARRPQPAATISGAGLTLAEYAEAKKLPPDFLTSCGVSEISYQGKPALRIVYSDMAGQELAVRFRLAMHGDNRFRWRRGSHVALYGLSRLAAARQAGYCLLVEGESDCQTLWYHDLPALGVPGASTWRSDWADLLRGLKVYVWQEPDQGGDTLVARVGQDLPDALVLIPPSGTKDTSAGYLAGSNVPALIRDRTAQAQPIRVHQETRRQQEHARALAEAGELPNLPDILAAFLNLARSLGLAGEERNAKLLYLALTSRLLDRPVSIVVKGPSSAGKSFLVETVLRAFPPEAFYTLSAMSERALAYGDEPLSHRFLVVYEAAGLGGDLATYLLRSLLSEGKVRYECIEKTTEGLRPRLIEREGPTGLLVTTTRAGLHPENETRMFSLLVRDDREQTRAVFQASANSAKGDRPDPPDLTPWHALQSWLAGASSDVVIPFSSWLADHVDSGAVRLRRDFGAILRLIQAHALLHQGNRTRDARGRIVAQPADYTAVYNLVGDLVAQGVKAGISPTLRETVEALQRLTTATEGAVSRAQVAQALGLDLSAASRRLSAAAADGYLVKEETRRGQPARWKLGEPLPAERTVLPTPEALAQAIAEQGGGGVSIPGDSLAHLHTLPVEQPVQACSEGERGNSPSPPAADDDPLAWTDDDPRLWRGVL